MVTHHSVVDYDGTYTKKHKEAKCLFFFCILKSKKATKVTLNILTYQGVS